MNFQVSNFCLLQFLQHVTIERLESSSKHKPFSPDNLRMSSEENISVFFYFKLSPFSDCFMFSSGLFSGV